MEKASRILVPLGKKILPGCSGVQTLTEYGLWSSLVDHHSRSQTQGMMSYNQTLLSSWISSSSRDSFPKLQTSMSLWVSTQISPRQLFKLNMSETEFVSFSANQIIRFGELTSIQTSKPDTHRTGLLILQKPQVPGHRKPPQLGSSLPLQVCPWLLCPCIYPLVILTCIKSPVHISGGPLPGTCLLQLFTCFSLYLQAQASSVTDSQVVSLISYHIMLNFFVGAAL